MKRAIFVPATAVVAAFLLLLGMASTSLAAPAHPHFGAFTNTGGVPTGSKLVLNITYKVTNDEDSGNVGYWALDDYTKTVQVWQEPGSNDGTYSFYAVARYTGQWHTFDGALSPGSGELETKDASGPFEGGYVATFTATSFTPDFGNIGTKDFGGTKADILLGSYSKQAGVTPSFDWVSNYFTDATTPDLTTWGWTYHYGSQTWNNYSPGPATGDIVD